jgi:hypothetical protein
VAEVAATQSVGTLVWAVAVVTTAAVVVGQPLQRSPGVLPVAPAAGAGAAGLGAQQPARIDPVASLGGGLALCSDRLSGTLAAASR